MFMNKTFKIVKAEVTKTKYFVVSCPDEENKVLENLTSHDWTPNLAQQIIDGVQKAKDTGGKYQWANEDVHVVAVDEGVFFIDLINRRGDRSLIGKGTDLQLSHEDFIGFMTDFKQFIEDNSK